MMKKLLCLFLLVFSLFMITACGNLENKLATPTNVQISETGLITWDSVENANKYVITINNEPHTVTTTQYLMKDLSADFSYSIYARGSDIKDSDPTELFVFKAAIKPEPPKANIKIALSGPSDVKSGQTVTYSATVTGADLDDDVSWSITKGSEFATVNKKGELTANEVGGDKIIELTATSTQDNSFKTSKTITITARPTLTQDMLDALDVDKICFEGYINITLYTIGLFEKEYMTYNTVIKTAMDGTNWYAEYANTDAGIISGIYFKNHEGIACQVGVSFMNDEQYSPMLETDGSQVAWEDAGLYNSLKDLKLSDFKFNEETWRYEYKGKQLDLPDRVIASANPYDFIVNGFSLIIEEDEILGIYAKSKDDFSIVEGYRAIQELIVAIDTNETVEVPTIAKYSHEDIHDELQTAIDNMHNLTSYTLDYQSIDGSYLASGYTQTGFVETITETECYFKPYSYTYDKLGNPVRKFLTNSDYGYKKINDSLYNAFYQEANGEYGATRAYEEDFENAKPTLGFAAEIFRSYYIDEEEGTTTYYVDDVMNAVASTFYFGVGNDIALYGIFATRGYTSNDTSFTPYVVVKDGYIIASGFYYYLGYLYGVVEITYSDFNTTTLPNDVNLTFDTRFVPTSWSELTIQVSSTSSSTEEDEEVNALDYLKNFYGNDNIGEELPFFGNVLGDTYGFGLTTIHQLKSGGTKSAVVFYYDVPLDVDYTIDSSLDAVEKYLLELGFVKNSNGEFSKGKIMVEPVDSNLDFLIYVWKA